MARIAAQNNNQEKTAMLVLSRKAGEVVTIGGDIKVTIVSVDRGVVRLGIEAPRDVPVHRKEVYDRIVELNVQAATSDVNALQQAFVAANIAANREKKNEE